jgi:o-succinylbenzoate synthase
MIKIENFPYDLIFKRPSGTSRGVLTSKKSYFIKATDTSNPAVSGWGECSLIDGLSPDNEEQLINVLNELSSNGLNETFNYTASLPALQFGLETALLDLKNRGNGHLFFTPFVKYGQGIRINGLIWMGSKNEMLAQVRDKIEQGFTCVKLKIGAIHFEDEIDVLKSIRQQFDEHDMEIRVDANGAFSISDAYDKLCQLAELDIHSIEQPIPKGNWENMANLCQKSPLSIALDEELIGINGHDNQRLLLETIQPDYCIFKPSLLGGFQATLEWIQLCGELSIPWWITSALESNIGLNAIAQFTNQFYNPLPQGLGTGQLYVNNIESPLMINGENLYYHNELNWKIPF